MTGHLADWAFDLGGGRSDECVQVVWECCRGGGTMGTRGEHQRWSEGARSVCRSEKDSQVVWMVVKLKGY